MCPCRSWPAIHRLLWFTSCFMDNSDLALKYLWHTCILCLYYVFSKLPEIDHNNCDLQSSLCSLKYTYAHIYRTTTTGLMTQEEHGMFHLSYHQLKVVWHQTFMDHHPTLKLTPNLWMTFHQDQMHLHWWVLKVAQVAWQSHGCFCLLSTIHSCVLSANLPLSAWVIRPYHWLENMTFQPAVPMRLCPGHNLYYCCKWPSNFSMQHAWGIYMKQMSHEMFWCNNFRLWTSRRGISLPWCGEKKRPDID